MVVALVVWSGSPLGSLCSVRLLARRLLLSPPGTPSTRYSLRCLGMERNFHVSCGICPVACVEDVPPVHVHSRRSHSGFGGNRPWNRDDALPGRRPERVPARLGRHHPVPRLPAPHRRHARHSLRNRPVVCSPSRTIDIRWTGVREQNRSHPILEALNMTLKLT